MVLNKSKWDHKAKVQYLKKHGLARPRPPQEVRPKWSSKKSSSQTQSSSIPWLDEDENGSDWDSNDEAILNHFYPQISDDHLPVDQKKKLKRQIVRTIKKQEASEPGPARTPFDAADGIYLGRLPAESGTKLSDGDQHYEDADDEAEAEWSEDSDLEIPDLEAKLSDFIVSDLGRQKNRKLLRNDLSGNLLDEYGIESYQSMVKATDYNDAVKEPFKDFNRLSAKELEGMRVGPNATRPKEETAVRTLTEAELQEHRDRAEKAQHAKFHDEIRKKFGEVQARPKVWEINNIDSNDDAQMATLNRRLIQTNDDAPVVSEDDLDDLLGISKQEPHAPLDPLMHTNPSEMPKRAEKREHVKQAAPKSDDFLDEILGL